jgi:hypothetical protein
VAAADGLAEQFRAKAREFAGILKTGLPIQTRCRSRSGRSWAAAARTSGAWRTSRQRSRSCASSTSAPPPSGPD